MATTLKHKSVGDTVVDISGRDPSGPVKAWAATGAVFLIFIGYVVYQ